MGPDADELDAVSMREFLDGIVDDTDELDADAWAECLNGAALDVLRLDPVALDAGRLHVFRGGRTNGHVVCELDPDRYPPAIGRRIRPHYDALIQWAVENGHLPPEAA